MITAMKISCHPNHKLRLQLKPFTGYIENVTLVVVASIVCTEINALFDKITYQRLVFFFNFVHLPL